MRKLIVATIVIALLGAGWYFGSPRWTLYQMREAAQDRDSDKLAGYIDFPNLRDTTKSQLKAQMAVKATQAGDGLEGLGAMFAMAMIDPMIDGFLTPDTMRAMFARDAAAEKPAAGEQKAPFAVDANEARIEQDGMDQFRLVTAAEDEADIIFKRHGLGWKLSEIRIPQDALSGGPASGGAQ